MSIRREIALRLSLILAPDETIQRILRQHHGEMVAAIEKALASHRTTFTRDNEGNYQRKDYFESAAEFSTR